MKFEVDLNSVGVGQVVRVNVDKEGKILGKTNISKDVIGLNLHVIPGKQTVLVLALRSNIKLDLDNPTVVEE